MKEYKVVDLSYSQDPRQHLKDVRAYHEQDGWRLLSVVHLEASGRWLYYLEREAEPAPQGMVAAADGAELSRPGPVRRVRVALEEGAARGTLDYLTLGFARFCRVAEAGGFEVGEATLCFDDVEVKIYLKVSLGIEASLLDPEPAAGPSPR